MNRAQRRAAARGKKAPPRSLTCLTWLSPTASAEERARAIESCRRLEGVPAGTSINTVLIDFGELDDLLWFHARPLRTHRLRELFPGECEIATHVLVERTKLSAATRWPLVMANMEPGLVALLSNTASEAPATDAVLAELLRSLRAGDKHTMRDIIVRALGDDSAGGTV